jgi:hypothetical protein
MHLRRARRHRINRASERERESLIPVCVCMCASRDPLSAQRRPLRPFVRPDSRSVCAARASAVILSSGINYSLHYQYHSGRMDGSHPTNTEQLGWSSRQMNLYIPAASRPAARLSWWNAAKYWRSNYRMDRVKVRTNAVANHFRVCN